MEWLKIQDQENYGPNLSTYPALKLGLYQTVFRPTDVDDKTKMDIQW